MDALGVGNAASRIPFACIMIAKGSHIAATILKTCNGANPVFGELAMKKTGKKIVNPTRIRQVVLSSVRGTSDHALVEVNIFRVLVRFVIFANDIVQRDAANARNNRKEVAKRFASLRPFSFILEFAGIGRFRVGIDKI